MKNIQILFLCSAVTMSVGCQREILSPSGADVLKAVIEKADTKVSFDSSAGKFVWTDGDEIAIHFSNGDFTDYPVNPDDGAVSVSSTNDRQRNFYAVYPASVKDASNYGNTTLNVILPVEYDIKDIVSGATGNPGADFSPVPMVAVNTESSSLLKFYHVGGLLRITLNGADPSTQKVRVTLDKDVTGTYSVTGADTDAPTITTAGSADNNVVTFTLAESSIGTLTTPVVLNVPVPCGTYNSVTVEALDATETVLGAKTFNERALTFLRHHGKILSINELACDFVLSPLTDAEIDFNGGDLYLSDAFKSYKTPDGGTTLIPVPFTLEYSTDGTNWSTTPPTWLRARGIDYSGSTEGQSVKLNADHQVDLAPDFHHIELAKSERAKTDFDLSKVNVATFDWMNGTPASSLVETANCYVVQGSGTYRFPLVYGNGVTAGNTVNQDAFRGKAGTDATDYRPDEGEVVLSPSDPSARYGYALGRFFDHSDNYITTPYIAQQQTGKTLTAALLWTDAPGLVTDVVLNGTGENAYISFSVPEATITQGNALLAVLADGDIAWSWHIWVTEEDLTATKTVSSSRGFMPVNLGWCDGKVEIYEGRTCQVRATQEGSGLVVSATVDQVAATYKNRGDHPFYQWGRKDPLQASYSSKFVFKTYHPSSAEYAPAISGMVGGVTIGTAIQHPYVFYPKSAEAEYDWCSTSYFNTWSSAINGHGPAQNDNARTKTIYDPSPVGFRVPALDDFSTLTMDNFTWVPETTLDGNEGRAYNGLYFPTTGLRYENDGRLLNKGQGRYWTSNPSNTDNGYMMYFSGLEVDPDNSRMRAGGQGMRPVRDN